MDAISSSLAGKRVLVTGASRGIGRAIAVALAEYDAVVGLVARDERALSATRVRLQQRGARAVAFVADLGRDEELGRLSTRVASDLGGLDVLIHAAGRYQTGPHPETSLDGMHDLWLINVAAPLFLTLGCFSMLRESKGDVVFINSSIVQSAAPGIAMYAASKRALAAIADSLRASWNEEGIRVLSVFPGRTATDMQARIHEFESRVYRPERLLQPRDVASIVVHAIQHPRTAEITDVHVRPFIK